MRVRLGRWHLAIWQEAPPREVPVVSADDAIVQAAQIELDAVRLTANQPYPRPTEVTVKGIEMFSTCRRLANQLDRNDPEYDTAYQLILRAARVVGKETLAFEVQHLGVQP